MICEVFTAVVTAETDPLCFFLVVVIPERAGDKMPYFGFLDYPIHEFAVNFFEFCACSSHLGVKEKAKIQPGASAEISALSASAVRHPESFVLRDEPEGVIQCAHVMEMKFATFHINFSFYSFSEGCGS
jgi:hypothetical protein